MLVAVAGARAGPGPALASALPRSPFELEHPPMRARAAVDALAAGVAVPSAETAEGTAAGAHAISR